MGIIKIMDESLSNMIAAGEVVENPAGMVKELLENSLDAGSKNIIIDISKGGRDLTIKDDGKGMSHDDLLLSVERHATSKIYTKDDLYSLRSYGFRGEALSSIAGVSKMAMSSRSKDDTTGSRITISGGKITSIKDIQMNTGTLIEIHDLFFNTPARLKFLRRPNTEYSNIKDIIMREALCNTDISISLSIDGKSSIKTTGNGFDNTIVELFSRNVLKHLKKFSLGYLGNAELFKANRDSIFVFVNKRPVRSKLIEDAVIEGYYTKLMKGKYPFALIYIDVDPQDIDVNVHPSKKIVKFANDTNIYGKIVQEVKGSIMHDDVFISPSLYNEPVSAPADISDTSDAPMSKPDLLDINDFKSEKIENMTFELKNNSASDYSIYDNKIPSQDTTNVQVASFDINKDTTSKDPIPVVTDTDISKHDTNNIIDKKNHDFKLLGQIFDTFILIERNNVFEIYDQHIVHERILYEELKKLYSDKKIMKQLLLVPLRYTIDPRDRYLIEDNKTIFSDFGFDIDDFSDTEIVIRSIPSVDLRESTENIFTEILQELKDNKNVNIMETMIISMSCKGAIKAGYKLTEEEMIDIIKRLHKIGIYTCPHGRPIMIKVTLSDLEKLFKRKL